jgi:Protein of unknown function (DUF3485)
MLRTTALAATVALVLLSGALAGVWSNRWGLSMSTREAAERLQSVPLALEGWEVHELALSDAEQRIGEIEGYLHRRYVNRNTGAVVSVLVLCGRPGPISVHTPEVCYGNSGWEQLGKAPCSPGAGPFQFEALDLRKRDVTRPTQLRLYMAMGSRGTWSVPKRPRLAFAGQSALFKVYVTYEAANLPESVDQGPAVELINALMPRLQENLFPAG